MSEKIAQEILKELKEIRAEMPLGLSIKAYAPIDERIAIYEKILYTPDPIELDLFTDNLK